MEKCDAMVDVGRRRFLTGATLGAAGVAAATMLPRAAEAATPSQGSALVTYPANRLGNVQDLVLNIPLEVGYPDADAPGVLLKLGAKVPGGVGPDQDIVGFSTTCPHKGFPLAYNSGDKTLNCPGHYSRFDCERGGQQVWGHATQNLPQYVLRVDDKGDIYAEGVDELLYGRLSNVL
ncbi:MAG: arsenite oxidase small subunit [Devosia sp. 67-54]|uniref:arsenate reductase (azurin) small subunit n=1 Tax=unclassified Devosia TaxID=196773 RepID=UPI000967D40E|nr:MULTISPECIES: arsenate reductase (azurin) small subunit [unclassified Devosia]MBN9307514.1 arsenate reductase (azurin) small subunit [Devosia sp.]OJX19891.1 MAG: arsenite oxidase small subunit [Devosia sp. 67-54]